MPYHVPEFFQSEVNSLINDELRYDRASLLWDHTEFFSKLNSEQCNVYDMVLDVVSSNCGGIFFVYGYGGTDKTFI